VEHVGAAILLAQSVVERARIEYDYAALTHRIGDLELRIGRQVGDDQRDAALDHRRGGRHRVVLLADAHVLQRETLVQEPAGGVVVVDRHLGARQPVVLGRRLEQRNGDPRLDVAQIADLDLGRVGSERGR
jgi:hypothetical protein